VEPRRARARCGAAAHRVHVSRRLAGRGARLPLGAAQPGGPQARPARARRDAMRQRISRRRCPYVVNRRLHLVSIATPPAFTGDGMPGDLDLDVTAAAGASPRGSRACQGSPRATMTHWAQRTARCQTTSPARARRWPTRPPRATAPRWRASPMRRASAAQKRCPRRCCAVTWRASPGQWRWTMPP